MRIVANVIRGGEVESVHEVEAVVVDSDNEPVFRTAHPDLMTYARSSVKPFQAYPLVSSGAARAFDLTPKELAICCASHNSEPVHLETVSALQQRTGIEEEMLECGTHIPLDEDTAEEVLRANKTLTPNYNNCSGKHTGMLLACKHLGYPLKGYVDEDHPLQVQIREYLESLIDRQPIYAGIDGCSLPTFYLSLRELALLFRQLAAGEDEHLNILYDAMTSEPYLVAGRKRFDTRVMEAMGVAVVSKVGAEGVRALGIRKNDEAYGLALKVLDGNKRASSPAVFKIFEHLGWQVDREQLKDYIEPDIVNRAGLKVGKISTKVIQ